jgi:hypothetical protein
MFKFWLNRQRHKPSNVKQKWQLLGKLAVLANLSVMGSASLALSLPLTSAHWQEIKLGEDLRPNHFKFETVDGTPIIRIESNASMSMLASPIEVDLNQTPVLC